MIDVSQSELRVPVAADRVPCILPNSRLWSLKHARPILGIERLALQSIFPCPENKHPDNLMSDLAGNAFNACVAGTIFMSALSVLSERLTK